MRADLRSLGNHAGNLSEYNNHRKMNYELAKKLKDAGFPASVGRFPRYIQSAVNSVTPVNNSLELVKIPSLEELIEAIKESHPVKICNSELFNLVFNLEGHWLQDFGYEAKFTVIISLEPPEEREWKCWGNSPEEAVAGLWLKLQ